MRVEVRSVAPDANPYLVMLSIFKTGLEGTTSKIKNLRQAERYLPDNIYTAMENFRKAEWTSTLMGGDVKGRYADLKQGSADRCPRLLGYIRQGARGAIPPRRLQPVFVEHVLGSTEPCGAVTLVRAKGCRSAAAFSFLRKSRRSESDHISATRCPANLAPFPVQPAARRTQPQNKIPSDCAPSPQSGLFCLRFGTRLPSSRPVEG